jgi:replicative DNA helicase
VSVAEIIPRGDEFERTPPHDLAAEQCVLGGMMLSKDAISDVLDVIKAQDYYRPAHQIVHDMILDLYGRGEPADAVTVAAELTRSGDIARVGGAPYLHTLIASVPTAANAGYYARIVRERAILRRLVEVGTRIVQLGYAGDGDADDLVDRAEAEIYGVTDRRLSEDYLPLAEIMPGALDEIEAIGSRGGTLAGVPTGFADLDALTNGLHPGQMVVIAARPAMGKALALDTPLPTPTGWTTMGKVRVGDQLLGADGCPVTVTAATGVMLGRPCYEVIFDDQTTIVADAEHQWVTTTRADRPLESVRRSPADVLAQRDDDRMAVSVRTTAEIANTLERADGRSYNHAVPVARPMALPHVNLPMPAYVLGGWLGRRRISRAALMAADAQTVELLCALGILDEQHVPRKYLRASYEQRMSLLSGLLDAGGAVTRTGSVQFSTSSVRLAADARELIVSLGHRCGAWRRDVRGGSTQPSVAYTITFTTTDDVFRLPRKRDVHRQRTSASATARVRERMIVAATQIASVPVRCVQVDAPDSLYLASRSMIPTHNSALALDIARAAAVRAGLTSVLFSLEMSRNEITMRLLSAEARVPLQAMRTGQLGEDDWTRLARRMSEVVDAPLFIDDSPNMSMMEIRSKCRRLKQRNDLKLVVIDYLQLMSSPKRVENRQQEVSELSRSLKLLAKELNVPVVALAQLNRGPEMRTDKRPLLADLRESGCLTAATRVMRADTNAEVSLGELLASGERNIPVWALDERLRYVRATMSHVFPTGRKETYALHLASGRRIEATRNHRFLTLDGWRPLADLALGSRIAVPRSTPSPLVAVPWPEDRVALLAHRLGDSSDEKIMPAEVFQLPDDQIALFLRHLWASGGSVAVSRSGCSGRICYRSTSRRLLDDVASLLRRLAIDARISDVEPSQHPRQYVLDVSGRDDQMTFLRKIGADGVLRRASDGLLKILEAVSQTTNVDTIPDDVWRRVRRALSEHPMSDRRDSAAISTQLGGCTPREYAPGRAKLAMVAEVLDDAELELLATNDVLWDEIVSVSPLGVAEVYDATVTGLHNFIADGIAVHNSIEQDADVVILLHREDAYERESPRAGEADLIVAKHRNGPTTTVTVAFQGHYSRFVDMAPI